MARRTASLVALLAGLPAGSALDNGAARLPPLVRPLDFPCVLSPTLSLLLALTLAAETLSHACTGCVHRHEGRIYLLFLTFSVKAKPRKTAGYGAYDGHRGSPPPPRPLTGCTGLARGVGALLKRRNGSQLPRERPVSRHILLDSEISAATHSYASSSSAMMSSTA
jgi:hypothetical protein